MLSAIFAFSAADLRHALLDAASHACEKTDKNTAGL